MLIIIYRYPRATKQSTLEWSGRKKYYLCGYSVWVLCALGPNVPNLASALPGIVGGM